tara:strand:+ start:1144 stop:2436 length:1293 start_codon:yes stop_codon:yes gene_type:complete
MPSIYKPLSETTPNSSVFLNSSIFYKNNDILNNKTSGLNYQRIFNEQPSSFTKSFLPTKAYSNVSIGSRHLTIDDAGDNFDFNTVVFAGYSPTEIEPTVTFELSLKLSSSSFSDDTLSVSSSLTCTKLYAIVYDAITSCGIVSFDINPSTNNLESPTVENAGSFRSGNKNSIQNDFENFAYSFSSDVFSDNPNIYRSKATTASWLAPIESVTHNKNTRGLKLGSTLNAVRNNSRIADVVDPGNDASLTLNLGINNQTISITGGSGYYYDDKFTVTDAAAGATSGEITVTKVDSNGAIVSTQVSDRGSGFENEPSISYLGSTGSGCSVALSNDYSVASITVNDGGNGYISEDSIEVIDPSTSKSYSPISFKPFTIITETVGTPLKLKNSLSIDSIRVQDTKNIWKTKPYLYMVDLESNDLITNTYISLTHP